MRLFQPIKLQLLVVLNVAMGLIALTYDWQALQAIPPLLLPVIVICPIYPFLLAVIWVHRLRKRVTPSWIVALAVIPAATYGVLAPLFYITHSYVTVFSWNDMGQIVWVWIYAAQAIYLIFTTKIDRTAAFWATCFIILSLFMQFSTGGYGYLAIGDIGRTLQLILLTVGTLAAFSWYQITREVSDRLPKKR